MKKKKLPVFGIIVLILLLLIGGGIWYWNTHKKQIIRNELEAAIRNKSGGLYSVSYDKMDLDEVNGNLTVTSFRLRYDSVKYQQLSTRDDAPFLLFNITIPSIDVVGVVTPRALLEKEISGRKVSLNNPVIEILYTNAGKDSARNVPDKEIYEQILGNLDLIKMDSVVVTGAEIITKNLHSGKTFVHFLNTSVSLIDVAVDSLADADTSRLLYAREVSLDCEKFNWQSQDGLYKYEVDSVSFRSASANIFIRDIRVIPQLSEQAFAKNARLQDDRLDISLKNLEFKNADFFAFANEEINTDTLVVGSASFKLYRDRNLPADKKNRVGTYPHQALQKLPFALDIKRMYLNNTMVEYREKSPLTQRTGRLWFTNLHGTISNVTNKKDQIAANNVMIADFDSNLLGKIPLSTKWTFYLGHPDGRFNIDGNMGKAAATDFNILAEPLGPARIEKGMVNSMRFNLAGNDYQMNGTATLLYEDLKVALLEKDKGATEFDKKGLLSFLANMKIKNDNPGKNDEVRKAMINYQRDPNKSIFNLAWKSLFEGVKEITGAK